MTRSNAGRSLRRWRHQEKRKKSGSYCVCVCSVVGLSIGLGMIISVLVSNDSVRAAWTSSAGRRDQEIGTGLYRS